MPQDKSEMIVTTEVILEGGRIKPFDKVEVEWIENKLLGKEGGELESMHPLLAEKLLKKKFVKQPTAEAKEKAAKEKTPKAASGK